MILGICLIWYSRRLAVDRLSQAMLYTSSTGRLARVYAAARLV